MGPVTCKELSRSQKTQEAPALPEMSALRRPVHEGGASLGLLSHVITVLCLVAQPCPTLCDPMDCSPPGSSVHGIRQARILEWLATLTSRGYSQPRDQTWVSRIAGRFFTIRASRKAHIITGYRLSWHERSYHMQKAEVAE